MNIESGVCLSLENIKDRDADRREEKNIRSSLNLEWQGPLPFPWVQ